MISSCSPWMVATMSPRCPVRAVSSARMSVPRPVMSRSGLASDPSLLAPDAITVAASYPLPEAAAAMARLRQGTHGAAVVLEP